MNTVEVSIDVIGEVTQERWTGNFSMKPRLSHKDELLKDRLRKEYLGLNPENSSQRAIEQAEIFSQLSVRIVKAPQWWREKENGLSLCDDSVIAALFEQALKVEKDALEEIQKKAQEAKKALNG